LISKTLSPVLLPRGTYPYLKVLICLAELPFDLEAARLAVDLVRMINAELHLVTVQQPELVAGTQLRSELEEKCEAIEALARMYQVTIKKHVVTGNPIREIVKLSGDYGLVVLPYKRNRRSFLTNPDVGQNLIHRVKSSVMIMPH
jgi:nucleotide-binding universal stress UspA family protein